MSKVDSMSTDEVAERLCELGIGISSCKSQEECRQKLVVAEDELQFVLRDVPHAMSQLRRKCPPKGNFLNGINNAIITHRETAKFIEQDFASIAIQVIRKLLNDRGDLHKIISLLCGLHNLACIDDFTRAKVINDEFLKCIADSYLYSKTLHGELPILFVHHAIKILRNLCSDTVLPRMRRTDHLLQIGLRGLYVMPENEKFIAAEFIQQYINGYEQYEQCKPKVKDLLVKSIRFLPPKALAPILVLLTAIMDKNDDRVRKSILTTDLLTVASKYVDEHGHEEDDKVILQINTIVILAIMTDKLDGILIRDHLLPLAKKLCKVANENIANTATYRFVGRIAEILEDSMMEVPCANTGCNNTGFNFKNCSACFGVKYCCYACQKEHWKVHKKVCPKIKEEQRRKTDLIAARKYIKAHKDEITESKVDIGKMVVVVNFTCPDTTMIPYPYDKFFSSIVEKPPFNSYEEEINKANTQYLDGDQLFIAICVQSDRVHATCYNMGDFWYCVPIPIGENMPLWLKQALELNPLEYKSQSPDT